MDYAVMIGLFGIWTAVLWRVVFVLFRGIERSLEEFKTLINERFDRQDERFDRQDERFARQGGRLDRRLDRQDESLERHGALILQLVRDVGLLTGALIGTPGKERERSAPTSRPLRMVVGDATEDGGRGRHRNDRGPMRTSRHASGPRVGLVQAEAAPQMVSMIRRVTT